LRKEHNGGGGVRRGGVERGKNQEKRLMREEVKEEARKRPVKKRKRGEERYPDLGLEFGDTSVWKGMCPT